ncbi:MAG TPA: hypothetical protein VHQ65_14850 [Thermoanaerobaculia bacterium]|nr:hypothetical protein [Thermoanaerobaculia bacterium]
MNRRSILGPTSFQRLGGALVPAVLALALAACSGGGGPTDPGGADLVLETSYGTLRVATGGNPFDPGEALRAIENGYAQASAQLGANASLDSLSGLRIVVRPGIFEDAYGMYHPRHDEIEMAAGVERVLRHELQHRFCYRMGHPDDCCLLVDHPGGYDLACRPL